MTTPRRGRARWIVPAIIGLGSLFPIYMIGVESLKSVREDVTGNPLIVLQPTLKWYLGLFDPVTWLRGEVAVRRIPFLVWLGNTAIVTATALAVTLVTSVMAAYALGRLRPPGWRVWRRVLFATYLIPQTLLFLPIYNLVFRLHLDDHVMALVLVYPVLAVPFCVWLLSAYYQRLAPEVEESAYIEGASRLTAFLRIILPMSWPAVVAAGIFALGVITSDSIFASLFLPNQFHQTLAAGLGAMGPSMDNLSVIAAVNLAALSVMPLAAAFAGVYIRGLTAAMVEGA
ncbi:MAG TPA: carbohydrate ABC transporter permease [bacterium]|nr:carbohydrate ABC transporter permease [bacterium]